MTAADLRSKDRHLRQEAEANSFAIELLTPREPLRQYLTGEPDLRCVLAIAKNFDISREAAARRYVSLHDDNLAVVSAGTESSHMRSGLQPSPSCA